MMWTKPYGMKEGFLVGGGLIIAGLMLELSSGPVDWGAFRWPVNGIVLAGFLALIAIIFLLRKRVYGFQFIGTYKAAIPALVYAVVLTIIMGLTPQKSLPHGSTARFIRALADVLVGHQLPARCPRLQRPCL